MKFSTKGNTLKMDNINILNDVFRAAKAIEEADALLITAGAGMGVDSGLPDFRGVNGFWREYPVIAKLGYSFEQMASPVWFARNPKLAWAFYGHRLNLYRNTKPHDGFQKLHEIGSQMAQGFFVSTSNVDGHFQVAGFDESQIEECHGSIHHLQCSKPCSTDIWVADDLELQVNEDTFEATGELPLCPKCGAIARPNILLFGDGQWIEGRSENQERHLHSWLKSLKSNQLVIIEIGAGTAVSTTRDRSEGVAEYSSATIIRINPRDYRVPNARHISLPIGGLDGINAIIKSMQSMA
jgi:NAD-dependent SIR2 family protein deacetylase